MAKALIIIGLLVISYFPQKSGDQRSANIELELARISKLEKEIYFWQDLLAKKPNYRDGWLKLTYLYRQAAEKEKAEEAIEKVRTLDPGYPLGRAFPLLF